MLIGKPKNLLIVDPETFIAAFPVWATIATFGPSKSLKQSIRKLLPVPGLPVISKNN